jgi:hypothetical protein
MDLNDYDHVMGSVASEFAATELEIGMLFPWSVLKMNQMYSLPVQETPTLHGLGESPLVRMQGFMKTLQKEMEEGREIMAFMCFREWIYNGVAPTTEQLLGLCAKMEIDGKRQSDLVAQMAALVPAPGNEEAMKQEIDRQTLVMLADWLGDMNVYNRSEALKYGIPLEDVLAAIMGSNFTKLGEDGQPIKDENGKVLKGPNFMPPEKHIYATLFGREALTDQYLELTAQLAHLDQLSAQILHSPMSTIFEQEALAQARSEEDEEIEEEGTEEGPELHDPENVFV